MAFLHNQIRFFSIQLILSLFVSFYCFSLVHAEQVIHIGDGSGLPGSDSQIEVGMVNSVLVGGVEMDIVDEGDKFVVLASPAPLESR